MSASPFPIPRSLALLFAAAGPVALGGILAVRTGAPSPLFAAPAIVFGIVAATSPALYIATAAAGDAPPLAAVVRAFGIALGAFGIALAGLVLPAAFLSVTSTAASTTILAVSAALGGAVWLGLRRLARELSGASSGVSLKAPALRGAVFLVWAIATLGIGARLWWDLAIEAAS